ncbi:MAG: hypothetical protein IJA67_09700 [Oscillospiraceae bacterium]|nr:hypothetical protein [Oscillospiraceae bacterium]
MNEQQSYISRQIAVYKTDKKLVELNDKMNLAPMELYAHIHAQGDEAGDGTRVYSNIGVVLQDYSAGTGQNTKRATANLSPDEVRYIFSRARNGVDTFEFHTDKIYGTPDPATGRSKVTKLTIKRATVGPDGKPRKYPWFIDIENGTGIPQKTQIGGTFCQQGSYQSETKIFANLNDLDFFKLFCHTVQYIQAWELANAPSLIRSARQILLQNTTNQQ